MSCSGSNLVHVFACSALQSFSPRERVDEVVLFLLDAANSEGQSTSQNTEMLGLKMKVDEQVGGSEAMRFDEAKGASSMVVVGGCRRGRIESEHGYAPVPAPL